MKNLEIEAAWDYHNSTKHSFYSISTNRHYMDWENQPRPFKLYSNLEPIPLPEPAFSTGMTALSAIADTDSNPDDQPVLSKQLVAEILFLSAGITRRRPHAGGEILFRAAACTGALYHIDLYLVCGDLTDLEAGVYHFAPDDFALRRLRSGDYRSLLVQASGRDPSVAAAPAVLISASTYWRNTWKYQSRAYRHCFWDNGTILANLLAAVVARRLPSRIVVGFVDRMINQLLGLDTEREAALIMVPLGQVSKGPPAQSREYETLQLSTLPLSESEVDYPAIRTMHEASSLEKEEEVVSWRAQSAKVPPPRQPVGRLFPLRPLSDHEMPEDTIEAVIRRRGSTRQFTHDTIGFDQLSTMLVQATRGFLSDFMDAGPLNDIYLIVNAVDGIPSGAYVFHRDRLAIELLEEGDFRPEAGHLGLGQEIPADASVDLFFLVDLQRVLERFGNRGYRVAQIEAAITAGKIYLVAYAQRLGATGLTFFDDDVTDFFSPHAAGKSVMFLLALGKALKRKRK